MFIIITASTAAASMQRDVASHLINTIQRGLEVTLVHTTDRRENVVCLQEPVVNQLHAIL